MAMFTDEEIEIFEEAYIASADSDSRIKCPFCPNKGGCHAGHWEDGERTPVECPHVLSDGGGWIGPAGEAMGAINRCFVLMSTEDRQDKSLFEGVAVWEEIFNDLTGPWPGFSEIILAEHHDGIKTYSQDAVEDGEVAGFKQWSFLDPAREEEILTDLKRIGLRLGARLVYGSDGDDRRMAELAEKEGGEFITDIREPDFNRETRISYRPPMTKRMDADRMQGLLDKHGGTWLGADADHPIWQEGTTINVGARPPLGDARHQESSHVSPQLSDEQATQFLRSWQSENVRIRVGPVLPSDFLGQIEEVSSDGRVTAVVRQGYSGIPEYMVGNPFIVPIKAVQDVANIDRGITLSRNGNAWNYSER